ncbi:uncharacterized protein LOC110991759 [Pieris rapae]|uniref:uncharacterized protein LOC110991759 n=1 Tax=Pieris rapae TaxID=64459 RepID=UPI001E27DBD2|nr:uncharacterized protein LOC110991759 [Pieris rapae]
MPVLIYLIGIVSAAIAAPPAPSGYYTQEQYPQINPLDYYSGAPQLENFYSQPQQKQVASNTDDTPSRLETLDPDSEVELIPGAQQPQQPPQQTPLAPNIPGLIPGQRVFIVHMPVPGIRPGTVGGYQPVYIVAAAPQGNNAYPGYQNPVLLDPSGQVQVPYQNPGYQGSPNIFLGTAPVQRPFTFAYPNPAYQAVPVEKAPGLNQFGSVQGPAQAAALNQPKNKQKLSQMREETKEEYEPLANSQALPNQRPKL